MENTKLILEAIEAQNKRFDTLEGRFDIFEKRFDSLEGRFDTLEGRFDTLEGRFDTFESRFDTFESRFEKLEKDVRSTKLTLENETNRGIQLVAEGHMALERKLDESLTVNQQKEMFFLKVIHLENEVRIINERIEGIV